MNEQHSGFRWNAGGWFGAQLGCTIWILVSAVVVMPRDPVTGLTTLALFLTANAFGTVLWMRRDRFDAYHAFQLLIPLAGLCSLAATWILDRFGHFETLGVGGQVSAQSMYLVLAFMIPALMLWFHYIEYESRNARPIETDGR